MFPFSTIPAPLARFIHGKLFRSLPPPPDDTPETLEARNLLALASIARLAPMNAAEAELAVQAVAVEVHANDALQSASQNAGDDRKVAQGRAQSAMMTRQAVQLRKILRMMQEDRREAEWHDQMRREAEDAAAQAANVEPPAEQAMVAAAGVEATRAGSDRNADHGSRVMKQNPMKRILETKSNPTRHADGRNDASAGLLAAIGLGLARPDAPKAPERMLAIAV